jgi:hypothetical protein
LGIANRFYNSRFVLRHSVVRDAFALLTHGLPNLEPLRLARCKPGMMRSDRRKCSCLAMVAVIEITASLKMLLSALEVEQRFSDPIPIELALELGRLAEESGTRRE